MSLSGNNDLILVVFHTIKIENESPTKERTLFRNLRDKYSLLLQKGSVIRIVGLSTGISKKFLVLRNASYDCLCEFVAMSRLFSTRMQIT